MGLFGGLLKNIFPKHTKIGKLFGSTRVSGTGIAGAIRGIFKRKKKKTGSIKKSSFLFPVPETARALAEPPPDPGDKFKMPVWGWVAIGFGGLVLIALVLFMIFKK